MRHLRHLLGGSLFAATGLVALASLAGCGGASGPAWPKSAGSVVVDEWKDDGGESIDPHASRATAVERSAEPAPETKVAAAEPAKPEPEPAGAGSGSGSAAPAEEPPIELEEIQGEEIIIEIDDD